MGRSKYGAAYADVALRRGLARQSSGWCQQDIVANASSRKTYVDTRRPARTTSTSESCIYAALYCAVAAVIILSCVQLTRPRPQALARRAEVPVGADARSYYEHI